MQVKPFWSLTINKSDVGIYFPEAKVLLIILGANIMTKKLSFRRLTVGKSFRKRRGSVFFPKKRGAGKVAEGGFIGRMS